MVEIINRGNDPVENLIRKFRKRVQRSGICQLSRKRSRFQKKENRHKRKLRALYRVKILEEKEKLFKLGRLEDEKNRFMMGQVGKRRNNFIKR